MSPETGGPRRAAIEHTSSPHRKLRAGLGVFAAFAVVSATAFVILSQLQWTDMDVTLDEPTATTSAVGLPEPLTSESPTSTATTKPVVIKQSRPVELYQPDTKLRTDVLVLPAEDRDPIHPPTLFHAYWDPEPVGNNGGLGTSTPDLALIAGHSWNQNDKTVFNPLYNWETGKYGIKVGDRLFVRTEASGKRWLVYKLQKVFTPQKGDGPDSLKNSKEIWGTDANPKPNHLLVITCKQKAEAGQASTQNIVFDFVFESVVSSL